MMNNMRNNYRVFIFQLGCTIIALSFGAVIGTSIEFASYTDKVFKNISIGDVSIGSETFTEAYDRVKAHYIADTQDTRFVLQLGDIILEAPLSDFILDSNLDEVMKTVFTYNDNLSFMERYKLLTNKASKTFEVNYTYDTEAINKFVTTFVTKASRPSQNATIQINTNGEITRTQETSGITIDQESVMKAVYNQLSPQACLQRSLAIQRSVPNTEILLDISDFTTNIPATITESSLEHVNTLVSSFSTSFTPGTGSDVNIALAAKTINGTLLMPGDTFSYNETIGNTTLDKGYTYATVIVNSQPTKGVGGGVCQVSTTLYNAILHTGLLPTERKPHSRPSSYVPLGLDATIDWGNIDFKFENTHDYPMYIVSYTKNNKVYVDIYSDESLLSKTYKFNSEVIKTYPSTTKYENDTSLPKGTTKLVSKGTTGYQVRVTRETYIDGVLDDTTYLYHDTYAAVPTLYKVGT